MAKEKTDLKDINGKEICKGDILKFSIEGDEQTTPYLVDSIEEWLEDRYNSDPYYRWDNNGEIIGNIDENPELLNNKGGHND